MHNRTYIIHNSLTAKGPIKSHMVRKISAIGNFSTVITTSCPDTFEYSEIVGVDDKRKTIFLTRYQRLISIIDPTENFIINKCLRCGWHGSERKSVDTSVQVDCTEGSEMERFVKLFNHTLIHEVSIVAGI